MKKSRTDTFLLFAFRCHLSKLSGGPLLFLFPFPFSVQQKAVSSVLSVSTLGGEQEVSTPGGRASVYNPSLSRLPVSHTI